MKIYNILYDSNSLKNCSTRAKDDNVDRRKAQSEGIVPASHYIVSSVGVQKKDYC